MRKFFAAAGALGLSIGLIGAGASPASAKERDRPKVKAVCEHRLCLLVLDDSADRDGDGVTDIDEEVLGTDAKDPKSRPEAKEIFEHVLARELPSFERRLTELVALPRNSRDGKALDTPLGTFEVPEKGGYLPSVGGLVDDLRGNGFKNFGTNMTVTLSRPPSMSETDRMMFTGAGNVAVWGTQTDRGFKIEGLVGPTSYGANGRKHPTGITDRGFSYGDKGIGHEYSVGYEDGSRDDVFTSTRPSDGGTNVTITEVNSYNEKSYPSGTTVIETRNTFTAESGGYSNTQDRGTSFTSHTDADGNVTASSAADWFISETTYPDGSSSSYSKTTFATYDKNGNILDQTVTTHEESADGAMTTQETVTQYTEDGDQFGKTVTTTTTSSDGTTTTTTTVFDEDDNVIWSETEETKPEECDASDCPDEDQGVEGEGIIYNPDSVGIGPVTAEDLARVAAGLNAARTPARDGYGEFEVNEEDIPPAGANPLVAMYRPDGVLVVSSGGNPLFNQATPRYDPTLNDLVDLSGATPPKNETEPVFWP